MKQLTHGSLFAGIGGFDLGFERAGIKTIWQVEIDEYCRRVLERHFPDAQRFSDVRECGGHNLPAVDLVSGGFPCQDISTAGARAGLDGERSGLWNQMFRVVCELQPRVVIVENVSNLLALGIGRILGDLAGIGYDAEWGCIPACALGAPHIRERLWIAAYPHANGERFLVAHDGHASSDGRAYKSLRESSALAKHAWRDTPEPAMGGVDDGLPAALDGCEHLGNAVVPQIAEWIGRRIIEAEAVSA